jgi:hypothetical protein
MQGSRRTPMSPMLTAKATRFNAQCCAWWRLRWGENAEHLRLLWVKTGRRQSFHALGASHRGSDGRAGVRMVYGGAEAGLMGVAARAAL